VFIIPRKPPACVAVEHATGVEVDQDAVTHADFEEPTVCLRMPRQSILVSRDDHVDFPGVSRCEQRFEALALDLSEGGSALVFELAHYLPAAILGVPAALTLLVWDAEAVIRQSRVRGGPHDLPFVGPVRNQTRS
jgi:hypothetical protein